MSLQLTVFPQFFDGSNPLSSTATEVFVDGINFTTVDSSSNTFNVTGSLPQAYINANTPTVNTWFRFTSQASGGFTVSSGVLAALLGTFGGQRLSNLTTGALYDLKIDFTLNSGFKVYQFNGTVLIATQTLTGTGTQTMTFTAASSSDTIVFEPLGVTFINSISVKLSTQNPSGTISSLQTGQVLLDLYEDEDIPLTLSVDDFKNVLEKVQSYSKAFKLPATKRNNKIFDNIFEITRTTTGIVFNPYIKTKCELKQDGFILFEGYLRLIDITDKNDEISYNVNLYSEAVALADLLKDKKFSDLSFDELAHDYNKVSIKNSWSNTTGLPLTNALSTSSFAYSAALGVNNTNVLKYPFVDWTGNIDISDGSTGTANFPALPFLQSAFRPFIQLKYLIDRIFDATPFTFTSEFFDSTEFKKLFMDFNFGADVVPTAVSGLFGSGGIWAKTIAGTTQSSVDAGTSFTNLQYKTDPSSYFNLMPEYNTSTGVITATQDGQIISTGLGGFWEIENTSTTDTIVVNTRWVKNEGAATEEVFETDTFSIPPSSFVTWNYAWQKILNSGDTLKAQFKRESGSTANIRQRESASTYTAKAFFFLGQAAVASNDILQNLRGDLGQFEFLKGIMTMFNLVAIPDKTNPDNILIEPYGDVFINNTNSVQHNWTLKSDVSEMKLVPLTELNKITVFKYAEDEEDFIFNLYKTQVENHLYGSKVFDASAFTILEGEEEVVAEPFAATLSKQLYQMFPDFVVPTIFSSSEEGENQGFENMPRILYNVGVKTLQNGVTYFIPSQNGESSENQPQFLQFCHLTDVPAITPNQFGVSTTQDYNFGECQFFPGMGAAPPENLFNLYWLPYYNELYNPDTRIMTIKVNLNAADIASFNLFDTVMIKNREFRVNKIDYKPYDLSTVEFILIP